MAGSIGVWTGVRQWPTDPGAIRAAAAQIEDLGFATVWIGGSVGQFPIAEEILAATSRLEVATGIVQIWSNPAPDVAAAHHRLNAAYPGRFVLGLGVGHAPAVEASGQKYEKPLSKLTTYLDELDSAENPVPAGERVIAALGPRALAITKARAAGAHPYNVPPAHTAWAREILGPTARLLPEHKVFFGADPSAARDVARRALAVYLGLPNYVNNLLRFGMSPADVGDGGSDRLVDTLVAWGSDDAVAARVREHLDAGADQVAVQVLTDASRPGGLPLEEMRRAARVLIAAAT